MVHIFVLVTGTWIQIQTPGYTQLQENCNNAIYDKWLAFDNKEGVSFSQFIWGEKYEQNIFSRRQLDKLFGMNGKARTPKKPLTTGYDRGVEPFATRCGCRLAVPV